MTWDNKKISITVTVEQFNALHNLTEEKWENLRDIPVGHPDALHDAEDLEFFAKLHDTVSDGPRECGSTAKDLESMRWVSFARCWLALQETNGDPEFDWFSLGFEYGEKDDFDRVLLDAIKAQAQAEGHAFPQDIEKTLRVMLHG